MTRHQIAIIEDNADNRLLLSALLGDDHDLAEYEDGPVALAALPGAIPDLILLDISLPGMEGPEVLRRIRALPALAAVPIVALTAHAMSGDRERFLAQGFDDYVTKPIVDERLLFAAIRRHLPAP